MKHRLYCLLASTLGPLLLWLLCRFLRVKVENGEVVERLRSEGKPFIIAGWHSRLIYLNYLPLFRGIMALVSRNRDGEYIARAMRAFDHGVVRGSTSSGGARAMKEMVRLLKQGQPIAITPDGPRGPAQRVQMGIIQLAGLSGAAIVPVCFFCQPVWRVKSWDRMLIPRGIGRGTVRFGEPFIVTPGERDALERQRQELEERMNRLTHQLECEWNHQDAETPAHQEFRPD